MLITTEQNQTIDDHITAEVPVIENLPEGLEDADVTFDGCRILVGVLLPLSLLFMALGGFWLLPAGVSLTLIVICWLRANSAANFCAFWEFEWEGTSVDE